MSLSQTLRPRHRRAPGPRGGRSVVPGRRSLTVGLVLTDHAGRVRGARRLDGHADRRSRSSATSSCTAGCSPRSCSGRSSASSSPAASSTGAGSAARSRPGIGLFAIGLVVGGLAPSMAVLVVGALPPGPRRRRRSRRSPTSPSGAACRSACGRRCSRRCRRRGCCRASSGRRIAGVVGETVGWRCVFLGLLPLIARRGAHRVPGRPRDRAAAEAADGRGGRGGVRSRDALPLALVVAAGTGLLLAGLTSGDPALLVVLGVVGPGARALRPCAALTPPGTLRAARGLPTAVLMRGILTFAFFARRRLRRPGPRRVARADARSRPASP